MRKLFLASLFMSATVFSQASEYGCKVLLCLSNPASNGGPKGVAECVPPISQLYRDLRKGIAFPSCDLADGNNGSNYARVVFDPYDPCPPSLQPAMPGSYVVQGKRIVDSGDVHTSSRYTIEAQPKISEPFGRDIESLGSRACVGKPVGSYHAGSFDDSYSVLVFNQVVWQPAQAPQAIDVFINNALLQRVRW